MAAMPRELARKQPATVVPRQPRTTPNRVNGRYAAKHGGPTLSELVGWFAAALIAAAFTGFLLSLIAHTH